MASHCIPRINHGHLAQHTGKVVSVVGRVVAVAPEQFQLDASDGGRVVVQAMQQTPVQEGQLVEVTGRVTDVGSVQEMKTCIFSETFDLGLYNQMLTLAHSPKFADMFFGETAAEPMMA